MAEMENKTPTPPCNNSPYLVIIALLVVISILMFFLGKNYSSTVMAPSESSNLTQENASEPKALANAKDIEVTFINDKRCTECHSDELSASIENLPFLTGSTMKKVDYSDQGVKELMAANGIQFLPAVLLNTNKISDEKFVSFLKETPAKLYGLELGSTFDPNGEICDNKTDDNADGKVDCDDEKCTKAFACAPKVDKPVADLYIMSYCPYGLQAQKGYLEVIDKL